MFVHVDSDRGTDESAQTKKRSKTLAYYIRPGQSYNELRPKLLCLSSTWRIAVRPGGRGRGAPVVGGLASLTWRSKRPTSRGPGVTSDAPRVPRRRVESVGGGNLKIWSGLRFNPQGGAGVVVCRDVDDTVFIRRPLTLLPPSRERAQTDRQADALRQQ